MTEDELIRKLTSAVRKADKEFQDSGGSSRHWTRDCFLPAIRLQGLKIIEETETEEIMDRLDRKECL